MSKLLNTQKKSLVDRQKTIQLFLPKRHTKRKPAFIGSELITIGQEKIIHQIYNEKSQDAQVHKMHK